MSTRKEIETLLDEAYAKRNLVDINEYTKQLEKIIRDEQKNSEWLATNKPALVSLSSKLAKIVSIEDAIEIRNSLIQIIGEKVKDVLSSSSAEIDSEIPDNKLKLPKFSFMVESQKYIAEWNKTSKTWGIKENNGTKGKKPDRSFSSLDIAKEKLAKRK